MPLGLSMVIWAVGIYTVIQSIEGYVIGPLDPASGGGTASGMDTGGHRPVRFPVRRMGHCTCDAATCSWSCCRPPALC